MINNFVKNEDANDTGYSLANSILKGLLLRRDTRAVYFRDNLAGNYSLDDIYNMSKINNVIMRLADYFPHSNGNPDFLKWDSIITKEKERCAGSVDFIKEVSESFNRDGIRYVIIKSLDHYPDFGNDVDIFVDEPFKIARDWVLREYNAVIARRKLSEVICGKMNVKIPGYSALELHCKRIGQVGEHSLLAEEMTKNRKLFEKYNMKTYVLSDEDKILFSTIHRLYRHFNFRISDMIEAIDILKKDSFNWDYVFRLSGKTGITEGVRYFLSILNGIYAHYFNDSFLPPDIKRKTGFLKPGISFRKCLFRIPLFRVPAKLFTSEIVSYLKYRRLGSVARLLLVPPLSAIVYFSIKCFGDDWVW